MKHIDILYFDIDGTLFDNSNMKIYPSSVEALYKLKENGYKIALCSGRPLHFSMEFVNLIEWDGYVLSNGSVVYDKDLNLIHEVVFEPKFIHEFIKNSGGPLMLEGLSTTFTSQPNQRVIDIFEFFDHDTPLVVKTYTDEVVHNILNFDMDTLNDEFSKMLHNDYIVVKDFLGHAEIIHPESGKDRGVEILNSHLNIKTHVGIGDGENDITFLKKADFSIAMGNASPNVKDAADYVTKSINEDGLVYALKKYEFIK